MSPPDTPPRRHRWMWIVFPPLIALGLLIIVWNWNWFIPLAEGRAAAALGRPVTIGQLHVRLRRIVTIEADDIGIANPRGFPATAPPFGHIDALLLQFDLWRFITQRKIVLPLIALEHPQFNLRQAGGGNNYTLARHKGGTPPRAPPLIGRLVIDKGVISVKLPADKSDFTLDVQTRAAPANSTLFPSGDVLTVKATGRYAGAPVSGDFTGGDELTLRDTAQPYPMDLRARSGATRMHLAGTLNDPAHLAGAHLTLALSGDDLGDLSEFTAVPVPSTPPFSLTGRIAYAAHAFRLTAIEGRLGSSDLEGTLAEAPGSPRTGITADLTSRRVDLADLAGFLGGAPGHAATPGESAAQKAKLAQARTSASLLPHEKINLPALRRVTVDLRYHGDQIINKNTPLDDLTVHLVIRDGDITADPVDFGIGSGTIASRFQITPRNDVLHVRAYIDFHRLPLSKLLHSTSGFTGSGTVGGTAQVAGTGNSVAAILGHGDGHAQFFMQHGAKVSALLVDLAGLQAGDAILSALGLPVKTQINCMVSDFSLNDGTVTANSFLLATKAANILGKGTANLDSEKLDLRLWTQATHVSVGSLPTPIEIGGTLKNPSVLPNPAPLAARAALAGGLFAIFPPLALLPTIRLGLGHENACEKTITALHHTPPRAAP